MSPSARTRVQPHNGEYAVVVDYRPIGGLLNIIHKGTFVSCLATYRHIAPRIASGEYTPAGELV